MHVNFVINHATYSSYILFVLNRSLLTSLQRKTQKSDTNMDLASDFETMSPSEITQDQAEVVLVGCGAPNRGMGWYHAVQMLEGR